MPLMRWRTRLQTPITQRSIKMKNYLCIDGKKIELTQEQLQQLGVVKEPEVSLSTDGKIAKIGEYEFIVLNNDGEKVELLLKETLGEDTVFGDNNDFKTSKVKKILDKFAQEIEKLVGADNLLDHTVDLMALDGLKEYGTIKAKMSLLTVAQVWEHVDTLEEFKYDGWWWLATPWSTPKHGYKETVTCVSPFGGINHDYCLYYYGVRPFCVLKSSIFQS